MINSNSLVITKLRNIIDQCHFLQKYGNSKFWSIVIQIIQKSILFGKNNLIQLICCKLSDGIKTIIAIPQKLYNSLHGSIQVYDYLCLEYLNPERKAEVLRIYTGIRNEELRDLLRERKEINKRIVVQRKLTNLFTKME